MRAAFSRAIMVLSLACSGCGTFLGVDFDNAWPADDGGAGSADGRGAVDGLAPAPGESSVSVAAGFGHGCVLGSAGHVKCWGDNAYGQVGGYSSNGSMILVPGIEGARAVAAGGNHTCVLLGTGALRCFGRSTPSTPAEPTDVAVLGTFVTAVTAGGFDATEDYGHTCVIAAGAVSCWGFGKHGQLGTGTLNQNTDVPVRVTALNGVTVTDISAGGAHTCVRTTAGGVKCWGYNQSGQVGDGTLTDRAEPVDVVGLAYGIANVAAGGEHTCALTTLGTVKCWGKNEHGQLGNNSTIDSPVPVDVDIHDVRAIRAGGAHTCALTNAGTMRCWGSNERGATGVNSMEDVRAPSDVRRYQPEGMLTDVISFAAGGMITVAVTKDGKLYEWGRNAYIAFEVPFVWSTQQ